MDDPKKDVKRSRADRRTYFREMRNIGPGKEIVAGAMDSRMIDNSQDVALGMLAQTKPESPHVHHPILQEMPRLPDAYAPDIMEEVLPDRAVLERHRERKNSGSAYQEGSLLA